MKKYKTALLALSALACAFIIYTAEAYNPGEARITAAKQHPVGESALKEITQRNAVSDAHTDILAPLLGDWRYTAAFHAVPGIEPQKTEGRITNEMILENRVLSGTFMGSLDVAGHLTSVTGQELISYDTAGQEFTSVRIDTMRSGMMIGSGNYDEKQNALIETGRFTDPRDGVQKNFRSELKFTDAESYTRTIFVSDETGRDTKYLEFEYSRP